MDTDFSEYVQLGGTKQCRTGSGAGKVSTVSEMGPEGTPETTPIRKSHSTTPELISSISYNSGGLQHTESHPATPELNSSISCNVGGLLQPKASPIRVSFTAEEREQATGSTRHSPLLPSLRFCAERALPFGANGGQSSASKMLEESVEHDMEDDAFSVCTLGKEEALAHSACKLAKSQKYKRAQTNGTHEQARKKKCGSKRDSSDDSSGKQPCATHSQRQHTQASPGSKHGSPGRRTGLSGASGNEIEEDLDVPLKQRRADRSGEGAAPAAGDEMEEDLDVPLKQRLAAFSGSEVVDSTRGVHSRNAAATAKKSIAGILKSEGSDENEHGGNGDDEAVTLGEAEEDVDEEREDMKWRDEGQEYIGKRVRRTIWGVEENAPVITGSADAQVLGWLPAGESVRALHIHSHPPTHTETNTPTHTLC